MDPVREDALVRARELARAGQHAAAVDPDRELKRFTVLQRDALRGQL